MAKPPYKEIHSGGVKANGDKFEARAVLTWMIRTALLERLVKRWGGDPSKVDAVILDVDWKLGKSIASVLYRATHSSGDTDNPGALKEVLTKYEEVYNFGRK